MEKVPGTLPTPTTTATTLLMAEVGRTTRTVLSPATSSSGPSYCPYSPNYLEEEFSEVRGYKLPRPGLALYQSGRGRATFSPDYSRSRASLMNRGNVILSGRSKCAGCWRPLWGIHRSFRERTEARQIRSC